MVSMPLVGSQAGLDYMAQRQVPASSIPESDVHASAQRRSSPPPDGHATLPTGALATNVLGHPLPSERLSPLGTPRADFAIAIKSNIVSKDRSSTPTNARIRRP